MSPRFPVPPGRTTTKELPPADLPVPRVEVVYYMGRNSGFATKDSPFAHVRLWSANNPEPMSMGRDLHRVSADEMGIYLAGFFGWPVFTLEQVINVERTVSYQTAPKRESGDVPD